MALPDPETAGYSVSGLASFRAVARVVGEERISIAAGNFDAWRVDVEFSFRSSLSGSIIPGEGTYWYSVEAKRLVKARIRSQRVTYNQPIEHFEIELSRLALGTGPPGGQVERTLGAASSPR